MHLLRLQLQVRCRSVTDNDWQLTETTVNWTVTECGIMNNLVQDNGCSEGLKTTTSQRRDAVMTKNHQLYEAKIWVLLFPVFLDIFPPISPSLGLVTNKNRCKTQTSTCCHLSSCSKISNNPDKLGLINRQHVISQIWTQWFPVTKLSLDFIKIENWIFKIEKAETELTSLFVKKIKNTNT